MKTTKSGGSSGRDYRAAIHSENDRRRAGSRVRGPASTSTRTTFPEPSPPHAPVSPYSSTSRVTRRFHARLASARDRQRLAERNARERERVEKMLAAAPSPLEAPVDWCGRRFEPASVSAASVPHRWSLPGCPVCGSKRVVGDEVAQLGTLRLSECLHCEHRWTQRGPDRWAEVGASMKRIPRPGSMRTVAPIRPGPTPNGDADPENPS